LAYTNPDNDPRGPWRASDISGNGKGGRLVESCVYPIINTVTKKPFLPPKNKCWLYNKEKVDLLIRDNRIGFRESTGTPYLKRFLSEVRQGETLPTIIDNGGFSSDSALQISELFSDPVVEFPKPLELMKKIITAGSSNNELTLDYFAGSGTTAHAILNLNREDMGNRRYILIEMADYFHTVLKPRIQKVMYSSEWKEGKPQNTDGVSHIFKYITLEQYEDTLNNIDFMEDGTVQKTLMDMDGYVLRYMLDFETRDSPCRMNTTKLERPFEYTLRITKDSELHDETVDLVETFNYLLGLKVKRVRTFAENGTTYRVVHGETLTGQTTTVVWRTLTGLDLKKDKTFIDEKILADPKLKAERIFINGDFHVEGALPIEPEFQRLMGA
jgi:adenine-specific DNA-methyltransferase